MATSRERAQAQSRSIRRRRQRHRSRGSPSRRRGRCPHRRRGPRREGCRGRRRRAAALYGKEFVTWSSIEIRDRKAIKSALDATIRQFGGVDILINTAALFPSSPDGVISDAQWALTLEVNVTANYLLPDETAKIFAEQVIDASVVLTSSANAVVSKRGSEAYDVSFAHTIA